MNSRESAQAAALRRDLAIQLHETNQNAKPPSALETQRLCGPHFCFLKSQF
jgi:hypothetical protein